MADTIEQTKSIPNSMECQSASDSNTPNQGNLLEQSNLKLPIPFGKSPRTKPTRRSLSGAPLTTYLLETKFQHFRAFHLKQKETKGLNFLLAPSSGAIYRSSLPVTPIATPIFNQSLKFTEQSLHERMRKRLQSPTDRRQFADIIEPDLIEEHESQTSDNSASTTVLDRDRLAGVKANIENTTSSESNVKIMNDKLSTQETDSNSDLASISKPASEENTKSSSTRFRRPRRRNR